MIIISHRGNIRGVKQDRENAPSYIDCAIGNGYQVEIDIRVLGGELWLGHDEAQYKVDHTWLKKREDHLWIHCKNADAAKECRIYKSFCHTSDPFTYTSNGKIWLHDLRYTVDESTVIPLLSKGDLESFVALYPNAYAVCTDYPALI